MSDASFEDGAERALRLRAMSPDDLPVISALVQDAVLPVVEMRFERDKRRFAMLLNRFRWEDLPRAEASRRPVERVQSLLVAEDVMSVRRQGIDPRDTDTLLSLLSIGWEPGDDGTGTLLLTFAGDGALALDVETLDISLRDASRPYLAPSGKTPRHPED